MNICRYDAELVINYVNDCSDYEVVGFDIVEPTLDGFKFRISDHPFPLKASPEEVWDWYHAIEGDVDDPAFPW